jgi:RNA polymerase sigma factor (sigma-70 family)
LADRGQAWDELIRRFGPMILGTIKKHLRRFGFGFREDLAADAYQEVFVTLTRGKLLTRVHQYDRLPGYLAAVAMSKAVDAVRSVVRDGAYQEWSADPDMPESTEQADNSGANETACPNPNPRDAAVKREVRDVVERELTDLPGAEAIVVRLKWQNDMTLEAISRQLELPIGTVDSVLKRARGRVQRRLAEKGITG